MVLDLKRIEFFKRLFTILLNFTLKLDTFLVEIIRRMFFPMSCYPGSLIGLFLWLNFLQLFLFFLLLPLLVYLSTFRRIFLIDGLHFLLDFGKQRCFSIIINGFLLGHFLGLDDLTLILNQCVVSDPCVLFACLFLGLALLFLQLVFYQSNDGVLVFHIEPIFP